MNRLLRERHDEEGSALVIALVFVSIFGLFLAAILTQTTTNLRTTDGARTRTENLYAADGGIEWGIQQARTQTGPAACADVAAGEHTLTTTLQIDGRTVTVKCRALAGAEASPAGQQWAVITTSTASDSLVTSNAVAGTDPITITGGDVWIGGGTNLTARNLAVSEGDVVRKAADCSGVSQPGELSVSEPDGWSCTTGATPDVPHDVLPVTAHYDRHHAELCGVDWRIFHPGRYRGSVPSEQLLPWSHNYFESGVYYFEDVGNLDFGGRVTIGGQPAPGDTTRFPFSADPACVPNDDTANVVDSPGASKANGKGVTFVLGGRSSITISDFGGNTRFELFTRVPDGGDSVSTPGISVLAMPAATGVFKAWQAPSGMTVPYALATATSAATGVAVALHGLLYAPTAPVHMNTRSAAPLMAGVVANKLTLYGGATGSTAGVTAQGRRTLLLTSSASTGAPGEVATVESAVVKIANDPAKTATARSWRVQ